MEISSTQANVVKNAVDVYIDHLISRLDNTDWRGEDASKEITLNLLRLSLELKEQLLGS